MKRKSYGRRRFRRRRTIRRPRRTFKRTYRRRYRRSAKSRIWVKRVGLIAPDRTNVKLRCRFLLPISVTATTTWTQLTMNSLNPFSTEYTSGCQGIQQQYTFAIVLGSKIRVEFINLNTANAFDVCLIPWRSGSIFIGTDSPTQIAENKGAIYRIMGNSGSNNRCVVKNYRGCAKAMGLTLKEYSEDKASFGFVLPVTGPPINSPTVRPYWYLGVRSLSATTQTLTCTVLMTQYTQGYQERIYS